MSLRHTIRNENSCGSQQSAACPEPATRGPSALEWVGGHFQKGLVRASWFKAARWADCQGQRAAVFVLSQRLTARPMAARPTP